MEYLPILLADDYKWWERAFGTGGKEEMHTETSFCSPKFDCQYFTFWPSVTLNVTAPKLGWTQSQGLVYLPLSHCIQIRILFEHCCLHSDIICLFWLEDLKSITCREAVAELVFVIKELWYGIFRYWYWCKECWSWIINRWEYLEAFSFATEAAAQLFGAGLDNKQ